MINEPIEANFNENYEIQAKEASNEILERLNNFIVSQEDIFKWSKSKKKYTFLNLLRNNKWLFLLCFYTFIFLLAFIMVFFR